MRSRLRRRAAAALRRLQWRRRRPPQQRRFVMQPRGRSLRHTCVSWSSVDACSCTVCHLPKHLRTSLCSIAISQSASSMGCISSPLSKRNRLNMQEAPDVQKTLHSLLTAGTSEQRTFVKMVTVTSWILHVGVSCRCTSETVRRVMFASCYEASTR